MRSRNFIDIGRAWQILYERDCFELSMRCHCVLAASMEFTLRPYQAYATTMVRPCHVEEDHTTLLTGSVVAYYVNALS